MQAAEIGLGEELAPLGRFDFARDRRIVVERHVRAGFVIITEEFR
jgi:hypothetical protein